ncbi:two-component sensor histidine kinase [Rhodobacterales bacterium HKCCE2091]|nr:two-component sensor histidine kinase [Rhodobacterales bacterium HKCCE2091]
MTNPLIPRLISAVPAPMLFLDRGGLIEAANPAAEALLGGWIRGRNHVAALRQPALLALIEATYAGGRGGEARFVQTGQSGQAVFRVTVTVIGDGGAEGVLLHFEDVTHLREAEEMRRDFVANVSHELRTPLTAILGFIETLRGPAKGDTAAQDRFLAIMEDEARRMNRIVSDLLSLSRVEGQERMRPDDPVALDDLLRSVAAALKPQAAENGNALAIEGADNPVMVRGDKDQLQQVVLNLAENALKYGGTGKTVTLRLSEGEETGSLKGAVARIEVIDQGEGIDPVHLPRLTERFYRVDTHRSRAMGGTGLGLAIVKHIVNRHRGRLKITSVKGEGSTFAVTLPKG